MTAANIKAALGIVMLWALIFAAVILGQINTAAAADEPTLAGTVTRVVDGDTFKIGETAIRLWGAAAPEILEPGGEEATLALVQLVLGKRVSCVKAGMSYNRVVAWCYIGNVEIAYHLVRAGLLRDCPGFSAGMYADAEQAAADAGATIRQTYPLPSYCLN